MELLLNDLPYLQKVFNSWLATEAPLSLTMKYGIPWIENVYTSQMIDYFRWIYVSQWNCISPFRIAIVNNLNIFPKKGSAKSISESSSRELLFFSHGCIDALAGIAWSIWQDFQDFTVILISMTIFGHHT